MTVSARRIVSAGALAVAAVAAPLAIAFTSGAGQAVAAPCLATVTTNGSDPVCVGYSNGNPTNIGTPNFGTFGPNGGLGVSTGNLAPGQTWRQPIA
ncbi:hypothetical protein H7J06_29345 [Mycobacterium hodleri]|uniref:DUF7155 family protein n=1 Tax=Mycolicibacterium hodleri TaxID=49897 RepID=UPI0021F2A994|nr:hypothetical protein [Mycolicibacterium hodleri]MCV7137079.1 hypothetical protein [Mycolicibacterium hodleri]